MLPSRLEEEVRNLLTGDLLAELSESEGMGCVVLRDYPLPSGYSKRSSDLLLLIPLSYPNGKPDMFWLDEDVLLASGTTPRQAESIEIHLGRRWRRFSWHATSWNPGTCGLRTYLEFVNSRLAKRE